MIARLAPLLLLAGCGGIVVETSEDASIDAAPVTACPARPFAGQACVGDLLCYRFAEGDPCPDLWECREGAFVGSGCMGLFDSSNCSGDAMCIFFHGTRDRCFIDCERACRCDSATMRLVCEPITCP